MVNAQPDQAEETLTALHSYRMGLPMTGQISAALVLAYLLREQIDIVWLLLWVFTLTIALLACAYRARVLRNPASPAYLGNAGANLLIMACVLGLIWLAPALASLPDHDSDRFLFFVFIHGAVCVAFVGSHHAYVPGVLVFVCLAFLPLCIIAALNTRYSQAALMLVFLLALIRLAILLSSMLRNNLWLARQRDDLLRELEDKALELEEANAAKSRFLAHASHDLRQPLHAVGLFMETLSDHPTDTQLGRVIERVRTSVGALSRLFDSLLDTTTLDGGQVQARPATLSVLHLFDALALDFEPIASALQVEVRWISSRVAVHSDPVLLRRMLQNLVANAVRHARSRVVVGVRRRSRTSCDIYVYDDGAGIKNG